jgi:hypothetical protein
VSIDQIASFFQLQVEVLSLVDISREYILCILENGVYVIKEVAEGSMFQVTGTMFEHSPGYVEHIIFSKGSNTLGCNSQRKVGQIEFLDTRMSQGQSLGPLTTSQRIVECQVKPISKGIPSCLPLLNSLMTKTFFCSNTTQLSNLDEVFYEMQKNSLASLEKSYSRHDLEDDVRDEVFLSNNPTIEYIIPSFTSQCISTPLKGDCTSILQSSISRLDLLP